MRDQTQLLRQVHPSFVRNGKITSQVFRSTPKDDKKLSAYDGDMISAENAFAHFVDFPDCSSAGVVSITTGDCAALDLPASYDPDRFPEHVLIDFSRFEKKDIEEKPNYLGRKLKVASI